MGPAPRSPCYYLGMVTWDFLSFHVVALRMDVLQRVTLQLSVLAIWSVHLPMLPCTEGKAVGSRFDVCAHALTVCKQSARTAFWVLLVCVPGNGTVHGEEMWDSPYCQMIDWVSDICTMFCNRSPLCVLHCTYKTI